MRERGVRVRQRRQTANGLGSARQRRVGPRRTVVSTSSVRGAGAAVTGRDRTTPASRNWSARRGSPVVDETCGPSLRQTRPFVVVTPAATGPSRRRTGRLRHFEPGRRWTRPPAYEGSRDGDYGTGPPAAVPRDLLRAAEHQSARRPEEAGRDHRLGRRPAHPRPGWEHAAGLALHAAQHPPRRHHDDQNQCGALRQHPGGQPVIRGHHPADDPPAEVARDASRFPVPAPRRWSHRRTLPIPTDMAYARPRRCRSRGCAARRLQDCSGDRKRQPVMCSAPGLRASRIECRPLAAASLRFFPSATSRSPRPRGARPPPVTTRVDPVPSVPKAVQPVWTRTAAP